MIRIQLGKHIALGLLVGAAVARPIHAQGVAADLPPCESSSMQSAPCRTPFDKAPVLIGQPSSAGSGERKTARVWVFVTETGSVTATQIAQSAGFDFDIVAVGIAKQLQFTPARLADRPVPAWFIVPITTAAPPEPCSSMAVPVSAGFAVFTDSENLERAELGTLYRFRERGSDLPFDVFIYPKSGWPSIEAQVDDFLPSLRVLQDRGEISSSEVMDRRKVKVRVRSARLGREITLQGDAVRVRLTGPAGNQLTSYFAVFPQEQKYLKVRVTYPPDRNVQPLIDDFVKQVLEARAAEPGHCPPL